MKTCSEPCLTATFWRDSSAAARATVAPWKNRSRHSGAKRWNSESSSAP